MICLICSSFEISAVVLALLTFCEESVKNVLNKICAKSVNIQTKCACGGTYLQNCHTHNLSGLAAHLIDLPTQALCPNPGHQSKGHHVPLGLCACRGSSPSLGGAQRAWFGLFYFVVVARLISSHLTIEQPLQIIICDGYSFEAVANEDSMESPRPVLSICMVGR